MRSTKAARRYHATHARLAEEVRARPSPDAPADAGDFIGAAVIVLGGAALVAFASLASPAHGMPPAGPETAQDSFPWMTALAATVFAAVALWWALSGATGDREDDAFDYRDAESRGGRDDG